MQIGIMQPYFFPYIGYWQLINAVDVFVVYDNIKFTKAGWIRRNRILLNGKEKMITLPLKKDSDYLDVRDRYLADTFEVERSKLLNQIMAAYKKAPQFPIVFPLIEACLNYEDKNLFSFIYNSIIKVMNYLELDTKVVVSSTIPMDHSLRNKERVIATCKALNGTVYVNPIGGKKLYNKEEFSKEGIELKFIKTCPYQYDQLHNFFVPDLSIIDVMMFNSKTEIKALLKSYSFE